MTTSAPSFALTTTRLPDPAGAGVVVHGRLQVLATNSGRNVFTALQQSLSVRLPPLDVDYVPTSTIVSRLESGVGADLLILAEDGARALSRAGLTNADTWRSLWRTGLAAGVRAGSPMPNLTTPRDVRHALLDARSVGYATAGTSGRHFEEVLHNLGIYQAVTSHATVIRGGLIAELLETGEIDIAVQHPSELTAVEGVVVAGLFPATLQRWTVAGGVLTSAAKQPRAAQDLLDLLCTPLGRAAIRGSGLEPLDNRQRGRLGAQG